MPTQFARIMAPLLQSVRFSAADYIRQCGLPDGAPSDEGRSTTLCWRCAAIQPGLLTMPRGARGRWRPGRWCVEQVAGSARFPGRAIPWGTRTGDVCPAPAAATGQAGSAARVVDPRCASRTSCRRQSGGHLGKAAADHTDLFHQSITSAWIDSRPGRGSTPPCRGVFRQTPRRCRRWKCRAPRSGTRARPRSCWGARNGDAGAGAQRSSCGGEIRGVSLAGCRYASVLSLAGWGSRMDEVLQSSANAGWRCGGGCSGF